jgi:hypothetical protein
MLLALLLACKTDDPAPKRVDASTSYIVYTDDTVDTGPTATPTVQLRLANEDGSIPPYDTPVDWTVWHGPAGGWTLDLRASLFGPRDQEIPMRVAGVAAVPDGTAFTTNVTASFLTDARGEATVEDDVRFYADWGFDPGAYAKACALGGQIAQVELLITLLDPETLADLESIDLVGYVELHSDPIDEPYCAAL